MGAPSILTFIILWVNIIITMPKETINHEFTHQPKMDIENSSWYRLPEYVRPEHYELWIFPQLSVSNFMYEGHVNIKLNVFQETNALIVHTVGLQVDTDKTEVLAVNTADTKIPIDKHEFDSERQVYIVSLVKNLTIGQYVFSLFFTGEVREDIFGFYRSSYKSAGQKRWLGITQFSPIHARKAFPCFDEPYLKATYRVHIGHYANETVTGNTVIEEVQEIKPGYFLATFAITPPMPTYLVGWGIHDFVYSKRSISPEFGLWTREIMKEHGSLFLNESTKIYAVLNEWIGVDNPIAKMEQIAVPDFHFSAMENWGMVTFRESVILSESGVTPAVKIHNGFNTVAHEYAHTWFGNLVTPKFWDVAWLKEGFATFLGYYAIAMAENGCLRAMDLFVVEVLQSALLQDSVQHNRTMNGKAVGNPKSITAVLDFVTYKKGASIIRMVYHIIGERAFHQGLQSYVSTLAFKHAVPEYLYDHLQRFVDQEIILEEPVQLQEIVESWANQPGYPIITLTRNYSTNLMTISQEKYYLNRSHQHEILEDHRWWVPINYVAAERGTDDLQKNTLLWIEPPNKSIIVRTVELNETIICNINQVYYYRVNYDLENWQRLISHLKSSNIAKIGAVNRASLIDDSFNLAKAGYIDYSIPLEISEYLTQETDYEPWVAATASFDFLNVMLNGVPDVQKIFQNHVNRLLNPIHEQLTFDENSNDNMRRKLLRNLILSTACSMKNVGCIDTGKSIFRDWLENPDKRMNPDSKSSVYCAGLRSASSEDWHKVLGIFLTTELHTEQELLIAGLGCSNNSTLVKEFLNYSFYDGPEIRKQYRATIFDAVLAGNSENVQHVLNFLDENFQRMVAMKDPFLLSKIFESIKKRIILEEQLTKFIKLVNNNADLLGSSIDEAQKAIEYAKENICWVRIYVPEISKWLTK